MLVYQTSHITSIIIKERIIFRKKESILFFNSCIIYVKSHQLYWVRWIIKAAIVLIILHDKIF